ncbi:MAG: PilZ domain-containing protein [Deltaproteobacteria bacterium]|nr:PilZ domain-containing protein [Deltaproteobacteria bacterium]MBW2071587.1 PilZ domain-containing protein [Deltaproteobacteria bacterium]
MKKDTIYTLRMSSRIREALGTAAKRERRTVASLLDKIITDYLAKEGLLRGPEFDAERRMFPRKKMTIPAVTLLRAGSEEQSFPSVVLDISLGGVLVTYPKGSEIRFSSMGELPRFILCIEMPKAKERLCFDCNARHMRDTGDEIQVGATFEDPRGTDLQKLNRYLM